MSIAVLLSIMGEAIGIVLDSLVAVIIAVLIAITGFNLLISSFVSFFRKSHIKEALDLESLGALRGVGPWTLAMVAMRGAGDPDAFPLGDLGVIKAWDALGSADTLKSRSRQWRPWRAYAANLLWRSLSP